MKKRKQFLAMLLSVVLVMGSLQASVFASQAEQNTVEIGMTASEETQEEDALTDFAAESGMDIEEITEEPSCQAEGDSLYDEDQGGINSEDSQEILQEEYQDEEEPSEGNEESAVEEDQDLEETFEGKEETTIEEDRNIEESSEENDETVVEEDRNIEEPSENNEEAAIEENRNIEELSEGNEETAIEEDRNLEEPSEKNEETAIEENRNIEEPSEDNEETVIEEDRNIVEPFDGSGETASEESEKLKNNLQESGTEDTDAAGVEEIIASEEESVLSDAMLAGGANPYPETQDVDGDGNYEIPCTRFAWQQAYDNHGISLPSWGNAVYWFDGAKNSGYSTGSVAQPGSIAVWSGDYYGHVAYVTSASGTTFTVNEGGRTDLDHTSSHGIAYGYTLTNATGAARPYDPGKTLLGFIYLNGTPAPPTNPTISVNKNRFLASDTITIRAHADGAIRYYGAIYNGTTRIWEGDCLEGGVIQYPASQFGSGQFSAYVSCTNYVGGVDTQWVSYTVVEDVGNDFYAFITTNWEKEWKFLGAADDGDVRLLNSDYRYHPRRIWRFRKQTDGSYVILNMFWDSAALKAGKHWALSCEGQGTTNRTNIIVSGNNGSASQRWDIYCDPNYGFTFSPAHCSLVMDLTAGSTSYGTNIQLYEANYSSAQKFDIYKLSKDNVTYTRPQDPAAASYSGETEVEAGKEVTITWTESAEVNSFDKRYYNLKIFDESGTKVYSQSGITKTNYQYTFGAPGKYYIQITAVNEYMKDVETAGPKSLITVYSDNPLTVTKSPSSVTVEEGTAVRLVAVASGYGLKYQWYVQKKDSATWEIADYQGSQSAILNVTADSSVDGAKFKCVFTDQYNDTAESDAATITIDKPDLPEEKTQLMAEDVTLSRTSFVYNGSSRKPVVTVIIDGETLELKTDYTVSYKNNVNVGTATVTVTGTGDYEGTVKKTFKIEAASIDEAEVTGLKTKTYTGKTLKQYPDVELDGVTLERDTDYTVSFKNNKNVGTATVTITGTGNYTGTVTGTFRIKAASIAGAEVTGIKTKTYTGKALTQSPVVELNGTVLEEGTDYSVSYANNTGAGTATVMITGKGNYTGTVSEKFTIKPASITKAAVTCPAAKVFAGWGLTPVPTVKINSKTLKKGTDFSLSYTNNKNVGTATVSIKGKGNYTGTINKTFKINPKPTTISTLTPASGKLTVTWKKQASQTTGYQIQYSSRSDFKTQKTVKITSNAVTKNVLGGLLKKHKYYVRIRTYKLIGTAYYYSDWSAAKSATTK